MSDLVLECSWCGRVKRGDDWVEEDLPKHIDKTHGMCEDCEVKFCMLWEQEEIEGRTLV